MPGCADLLYSFGISHPGALRLHNFPKHLQNLNKDTTGEPSTSPPWTSCATASAACRATTSSAACSTRSRSTCFEELTDNPQWAEEIKRVYDGDLEKVDLLVGLMGEPLPEGFGFSDTAFRVFILMASRRLKSDRFLSTGLHARRCTRSTGIEWVEETTMIDVLKRHVRR